MKINIRSKIAVRWTTNPADMGYDGITSRWQENTPEIMGVRRAAAYYDALGQRVGAGTYRRVSYQWHGQEVRRDQLQHIVDEADYRQSQR